MTQFKSADNYAFLKLYLLNTLSVDNHNVNTKYASVEEARNCRHPLISVVDKLTEAELQILINRIENIL